MVTVTAGMAEDYARDGVVIVGHRTYPEGPMQEVEALLEDIVREAVGD